jgi:DNA polymerase I-like protein with 3'-5' exonuclease and polymerase domains
MQAHKATYLTNPWGYRHYFYDVFGKNREGERTLQDDAKRCVAFLPQSSAAAFMKDTLLILWHEHPWVRPYLPANGSVHDSVCLDVPPDKVEAAVELLAKVMTREIPEMGGLRVGCEVKVGRNWAPYEETANPLGMKKTKVVTV